MSHLRKQVLMKTPTTPVDKDFVPPTFKPFSPRNTVPAACEFTNATGNYTIIVTRTPKVAFGDRLELVRDPPKYKMCLFPSNSPQGFGQAQAYVDLSELKEYESARKKVATLTFPRFLLEIKFKEEVLFQYFTKMCHEILKINSDKEEEYECPKQVKSNYKFVEEKTNKVLALSKRVVVAQRRQFHVIPSTEWKTPEWNDWMKHIRMQYGEKAKVLNLYEVLSSIDEKNDKSLYRTFINYLSEDSNTYSILLSEIKKFEEGKTGEIDPEILSILQDEEIRPILKRECKLIKENDGNFNTPYFLVLEKRIKALQKSLDSQKVRLWDLQEQLLSSQRFRWSVAACRSHILSILLFRKDFESWVNDKTREFSIYEKRQLEDKIGDVDWYDDDVPLKIHPDDWTKVLNDFNESNKLRMEYLSFKVMIKKRQNDLRIKFRDFQASQVSGDGELVEVQKRITAVQSQLDLKNKRVDGCKTRIEMFRQKTPPNTRGIAGIERIVAKESKVIEGLVKEMRGLEDQVSQFLGKDRQGEMLELEEEIKDCVVGLRNEESPAFRKDSGRRIYMEKLLKDKLFEASKKGMSEFGVQLVISILGGHKVPKWQQELLKKVDKFISPDFYRWGLVHANCQIANLGCHFFSDSLVMLTDLAVGRKYEEIIAIECYCALMMDYRTAYTRLSKFAEEIVNVNVNYQYQQYSIINRNSYLNCQEFAKKLIDNLSATKFFPPVIQYLEELRGILEDTKDQQSSSNLRFLKITSSIKETFKAVFDMKEFKLQGKKKNKLVFRSHAKLDNFFLSCQDVDDDFELNYPGIYQLLKGFDRAFWIGMSNKQRKDYVSLQPSESGCPFSQSGKVIEGGDDEEEVEGED